MQKGNSKEISSKILAYLKKNIYYVMMICCVVAIATTVTVVAVVNSPKEVVNPPINDGGNNDKPIDKPIIDSSMTMVLPVSGGKVSREFNDSTFKIDVTTGNYTTHTAVDISGSVGASVVAMYDGLVKEVSTDNYYGTVVVIEHKDGYVSTIKLLDKVTVTKNQRVAKGDKIGVIGGTFLYENGQDSHIHCELTKDAKEVDMMQFIADGNK